MKNTILITGSEGMLGVDLGRILSKAHGITYTDIAKKRAAHRADGDFIRCDLADKKSAIETVKKSKADVVLHTAAWTDVDGCELDKEMAIKINTDGTNNVASGCRESGAAMIYISSDFIFDGNKSEPYREDDPTNPLNAYGLSKLKGEEAVRKLLERYVIVRTSWLFGRHGKNFVDIILDKADRKERLKVVMDQFGSPTFTKDLSRALEKLIALSSRNKWPGEVYHFCNSGSCSWYKYAQEILTIAGKDTDRLLPITSLELGRPAVRPGMSVLNTDKYCRACGETPRKWDEALRDYLVNELKITEKDNVWNSKR